jgi:hypothetical protein
MAGLGPEAGGGQCRLCDKRISSRMKNTTPRWLREGAPSQPLKTQKIGAIRLRRVMGERPASLSRYS